MRVCLDQVGLVACLWGIFLFALIDWKDPVHCVWHHYLHLSPELCKREPELRDVVFSLPLC